MTEPDPKTQEQEPKAPEQEPKALTDEEIQKIKDSSFDKARNQLQEQHQKELEDAIKQAKADAIKEVGMTAEEKAQKEYEDRIKKLDEREAEIAKNELSSNVSRALSDAGLPAELSEELVALGDFDAAKGVITKMSEVISSQVNEQVTEKLNTGKPNPNKSNLDVKDEMSEALGLK